MKVTPLNDFQHGSIAFRAGVAENVPDAIAGELERAGLVAPLAAARERAAPTLTNKMQPDPEPAKVTQDRGRPPKTKSRK